MLHQFSWSTYMVIIACLLSIYYGYVGIAFYRAELSQVFYRLTGKRPELRTAGRGDLQIPAYDVMGKARPDDTGFISQDELFFAPSEMTDEDDGEASVPAKTADAPASGLISSFSEMSAELKTLIRVINESGESKESFEMLFCLIIQKYPELKGTHYEEQVNDLLLSEGAPQFPFELSAEEIKNYWISGS